MKHIAEFLKQVNNENAFKHKLRAYTTEKVSVFGVILVRIFPSFFRIRTEYGEIQRISLYSVRMQENAGKMQTRITPNPDSFYDVNIARKMKFSIMGFVSKCYQIRKKTADLVTFY